MDRWVAGIQADRRDVPKAQKVREGRPEDLTDRCETADGQSTPPGACPHVRYYDAPTQVAGEGPRNDVLKCRLEPIDAADYPPTMLPAQLEALKAVFPDGVCDWSRPGVGETGTVPWLTFADGPGGRALGAAPVSEPFTVDDPVAPAPQPPRDAPGAGTPAAGAPAPSGPALPGASAAAPGSGPTTAAPTPSRTTTGPAGRVRATLTRRVLLGRRLRLACRLTGATLRTCRVTVLVRRGTRTRALRTVTIRPGRTVTVRTGTARRLVLRARVTATDGRRLTAARTLTRSR